LAGGVFVTIPVLTPGFSYIPIFGDKENIIGDWIWLFRKRNLAPHFNK
jgi:hypothetical protein